MSLHFTCRIFSSAPLKRKTTPWWKGVDWLAREWRTSNITAQLTASSLAPKTRKPVYVCIRQQKLGLTFIHKTHAIVHPDHPVFPTRCLSFTWGNVQIIQTLNNIRMTHIHKHIRIEEGWLCLQSANMRKMQQAGKNPAPTACLHYCREHKGMWTGHVTRTD